MNTLKWVILILFDIVSCMLERVHSKKNTNTEKQEMNRKKTIIQGTMKFSIKTIIIVLLLVCTNNCYSNVKQKNNYSEITKQISELNSEILVLKKNLSKNNASIETYKSRNNSLDTLLKQERRTSESYAMILSLQTAIFSIIVGIAIFIIGFILPRANENKYKKLIKELEVKSSKDRATLEASVSFLDMVRLIDRKAFKNALAAGFNSINKNLEYPCIRNAKRIGIALSYIVMYKSEVPIEELKEVLLKSKLNLDNILSKLHGDEFSEVYNSKLEEFTK